MSTLVHCDGPDCDQTRGEANDIRAFATPHWLHVEQDQAAYDFHNRTCLAKWADDPTAAADILRAAAAEYMAGGWHDGINAFGAEDVVDDVSFAKATANWLDARADAIGGKS